MDGPRPPSEGDLDGEGSGRRRPALHSQGSRPPRLGDRTSLRRRASETSSQPIVTPKIDRIAGGTTRRSSTAQRRDAGPATSPSSIRSPKGRRRLSLGGRTKSPPGLGSSPPAISTSSGKPAFNAMRPTSSGAGGDAGGGGPRGRRSMANAPYPSMGFQSPSRTSSKSQRMTANALPPPPPPPPAPHGPIRQLRSDVPSPRPFETPRLVVAPVNSPPRRRPSLPRWNKPDQPTSPPAAEKTLRFHCIETDPLHIMTDGNRHVFIRLQKKQTQPGRKKR